ncbi:MAG: hypothetical protein B6I36_10990 [Desulfobacteraceae bacterium 4572_35.1]|nr:MAG: hypothetical protein B6I36_10990 [Desulfobacteraceae bacterium 4572_35.1]
MKNSFYPAKAGINFEESTQKLYLFSADSVSVMYAWPPKAWQKTTDSGWQRVRPQIDLPRYDVEKKIAWLMAFRKDPAHYRSKKMAWLKWYATIPKPIRIQVARFKSRQWHILSFLAHCGDPAYDLVKSNPALAYSLASNWVFHKPAVKQPLRSARSLLAKGKKQKDILAWLGFPPTELTRKVLMKISHESITVERLLYLREALANPAVQKQLSHLSVINAGVLRIVCDKELCKVVSHVLLQDVSLAAKENSSAQVVYLLEDLLRLWRLLRDRPLPIRSLTDAAKVQQLHDQLTCESHQVLVDDSVEPVTFPAPPVEGDEMVVPITDSRMLLEEARQQHNCVLGYFDDIVVRQNIYLYRILGSQRCTLALEKRGSKWVATQMRAVCNDPASDQIATQTRCWLAERGIQNAIGQRDVLELY